MPRPQRILDQRNTPTKAPGTSLAKKLMPHHTTSFITTVTSIKLLHPKVPSMLKMKRQKSLMITIVFVQNLCDTQGPEGSICMIYLKNCIESQD
ncbi:hypothetical protein pdam_00023656, partial [Pocillopora damicornis]